MTWLQQSNYWRGIREDQVTKWQQRGISIPNPDSVKPSKPFITNKCNNQMEPNKLKRGNYFTKELLLLGARGFSEEEVNICANITAGV